MEIISVIWGKCIKAWTLLINPWLILFLTIFLLFFLFRSLHFPPRAVAPNCWLILWSLLRFLLLCSSSTSTASPSPGSAQAHPFCGISAVSYNNKHFLGKFKTTLPWYWGWEHFVLLQPNVPGNVSILSWIPSRLGRWRESHPSPEFIWVVVVVTAIWALCLAV